MDGAIASIAKGVERFDEEGERVDTQYKRREGRMVKNLIWSLHCDGDDMHLVGHVEPYSAKAGQHWADMGLQVHVSGLG